VSELKYLVISALLLCIALIVAPVLATAAAMRTTAVDTTLEERYLSAALDYIETNRKGTVNVQLLDAATGLPISSAVAEYQQASHDFIFGSMTLPWGSGTPDMISRLGLEWSGSIALHWALVEPSHGFFDFRSQDSQVDQLLQNGHLRVWGHFFGLLSPDWNSRGWGPLQAPSYSNFDKINDPAVFEQYKQLLYEFVSQTVAHYRGKIAGYMTQLEVNWPSVAIRAAGATSPSWTIAQAVEVEKVVTKAIRDTDPKALVILGTSTIEPVDERHSHLRGTDLTPMDFTRLCIKSGVDFDMVGLEVYPANGSPASYYNYVKELAGLGKPVFINECGYPSSRPEEWINAQPNPEASAAWLDSWKWHTFDQHTQALWYKYMFALMFGLKGAGGVNLWLVRDIGNVGVTSMLMFKIMGVYDVNGRVKEAGVVLRDLIANFTTSGTEITSAEGKLALTGFAGNYTVNVEGYESFTIHVPECSNNTIILKLSSIALRDRASRMLANVKANVTTVGLAFRSSEAKSLFDQSLNEYQIAQLMLQSKNYTEAIQHAQNALDLFHQARSKEGEYWQLQQQLRQQQAQIQQARLVMKIAEISVGLTVLVAVGAAIIYRRRRRLKDH
jgi:hypothetical protein